jgi:hypothetical protein
MRLDRTHPFIILILGVVLALVGGYGWAMSEVPDTIMSPSIAVYSILILLSSFLIFPSILNIISNRRS